MSTTNTEKEDPPPYLTVGTEVSAKFKGAFCEAKITKLDKSVKCKLTYKNSNESVTLNDGQLKQQNGQPLSLNDFKLGSIVYIAKNNDITNLQPAILNKVLDQSVYTVIFNDGDEKTMKRSFIRFKGEKHFLESETLNNAPLNNPEHFYQPIKQKDSDEKTNNNSNNNIKTNTKDNDNVELSNDEENNEDNCSVSSDECSPEERDRFVAQLYKFMDDRGTPMNKIPSINKTDLDLYKLFNNVKKMGGFNKVTKQRSWNDVYKKLNLPNPNNSQNILNLKSAYERYLQPYEEISRKLGGNMIDYSAGSSTSKRTSTLTDTQSRTNQLFKRQVITLSNSSKSASNQKKKQTKQKTNTLSVTASSPATTSSTVETNEPTLDILASKEPTIESLSCTNDDQNQQGQEEPLTLFSMVQNLNENYKKAKKEKLEKKENCDEVEKKESIVTNEDINKPIVGKKIKAKQANKIISKSNSNDNKSNIKLEALSDNNEDNDDDSEIKPKKKSKRLSLSTNDEPNLATNSRGGYKRKGSIGVGANANNVKDEKNNESENDNKDSSSQDGNQMEVCSNDAATINTDTDLNENDFKTILSIGDLVVNKLVDVKYGGTQKQQMYRAKIVQINADDQTILVHYLGWNNRYDEWVKLERIIRMLDEDNNNHSKKRKVSKLSHKENKINQIVSADNTSKQNTDRSSSSSSTTSSTTSKPAKNTKISKRDSTSSSASSVSDQPAQIKEEISNNTNQSIDIDTKSIPEIIDQSTKSSHILKLKTRSSNSTNSSSSSIILPPPVSSSKSIDDKLLQSDSATISTTSLLSIKKEIVDFESQSSTAVPSCSPVVIQSTEIIAQVTTSNIDQNVEIEQQLKKTENSEQIAINLNKKPNTKNTPKNSTTKTTSKPISTRKESHQIDSTESIDHSLTSIPKEETNIENNSAKSTPINFLNQKSEEIENQSETESPTKSINDSKNTSKNENLTNLTNTTSNECQNSKYSFHIINTNLFGKQRIKHIEEQMKLCREAYTKLKNEVAAIDRKKKKLKRDLLEKSSSNNNNNNNDENLNNSKQDAQTTTGSTNPTNISICSNSTKKINDLKC